MNADERGWSTELFLFDPSVSALIHELFSGKLQDEVHRRI